MNKQKPIILNQSELDWETWDDPDLATRSPIRWKILVSGERGTQQSAQHWNSRDGSGGPYSHSITTNPRKRIMSSVVLDM